MNIFEKYKEDSTLTNKEINLLDKKISSKLNSKGNNTFRRLIVTLALTISIGIIALAGFNIINKNNTNVLLNTNQKSNSDNITAIENEMSDIITTKTFENSDFGYILKYPSNYTISKVENTDDTTYIVTDKNKTFNFNIYANRQGNGCNLNTKEDIVINNSKLTICKSDNGYYTYDPIYLNPEIRTEIFLNNVDIIVDEKDWINLKNIYISIMEGLSRYYPITSEYFRLNFKYSSDWKLIEQQFSETKESNSNIRRATDSILLESLNKNVRLTIGINECCSDGGEGSVNIKINNKDVRFLTKIVNGNRYFIYDGDDSLLYLDIPNADRIKIELVIKDGENIEIWKNKMVNIIESFKVLPKAETNNINSMCLDLGFKVTKDWKLIEQQCSIPDADEEYYYFVSNNNNIIFRLAFNPNPNDGGDIGDTIKINNQYIPFIVKENGIVKSYLLNSDKSILGYDLEGVDRISVELICKDGVANQLNMALAKSMMIDVLESIKGK